MDMALYRKIVDEAATIPHFKQLCITGLGETLLDSRLIDRLLYAREKAPWLLTDIFTNGSLLTPAKFDLLKSAGLVRLNISLNASSATDRERVMGLRDWERVQANIAYALAHKGSMQIEIHAVVNEDQFTMPRAEILAETFGILHEGGHVIAIQEGNWAGSNRTIESRTWDPKKGCHRAFDHIYVTYDGLVTTCCQDPFGDGKVFGDLKAQTIREVYNSPAYVAFREAHAENRADEYEFCARCCRL